MLELTVEPTELFDEENETFIQVPAFILQLEHSLISVAKWESKWKKSFIETEHKTQEELVDYVRMMTKNQHVPEAVYFGLNIRHWEEINRYLDDPMSATTFVKKKGSRIPEVVTAELIYYWMIALNIPFECQKWHLNRLLSLIRVCNLKNAPEKKMSKNEIYERNRSLNAMRKAAMKAKG